MNKYFLFKLIKAAPYSWYRLYPNLQEELEKEKEIAIAVTINMIESDNFNDMSDYCSEELLNNRNIY